MQYVGRAIGSVSRTWNSLNSATLSGAIDVLVVKHPDHDDYHSTAFHIRFGLISLIRPSQKGVDFYVNGRKIDVQMKLGEGGEAFFVFATHSDVPESLLTSPVVSPSSSPQSVTSDKGGSENSDVDFLDISNSPGGTSKDRSRSPPRDRPATPPTPSSPRAPGEFPSADGIPEFDSDSATIASDPSQLSDASTDSLEPRLRGQDPAQMEKIVQRLLEAKIPSTQDDDGSVIMDMTGYKPGGRNAKELEKVVMKVLDSDSESSPGSNSPAASPEAAPEAQIDPVDLNDENDPLEKPKHYVKTLRLSSDILESLELKPGKNDMKFVVRSNGATIEANIYLWEANTPVVISDIDGTITKSDAMGHIMTLMGRDWTHPGVGKLFSDISHNGYNILYLTSRSVGLADITRSYLRSIDQNGFRLPNGPVILSPDRTVAALKREVIMRKPEIFKMACLRDIKKLYEVHSRIDETPFWAGFGNRITDGLSYRSVGVPSQKIFTINTNSEVDVEALQFVNVKSSYIKLSDLVDHWFPPVLKSESKLHFPISVEFSDSNFWKSPLPDLSDDDVLDDVLHPDQKVTAKPFGPRQTTQGLDWERNLTASFVDDDYDSSADQDYEDSGDEDDDEDDDEEEYDDEEEESNEGEDEDTDRESEHAREDRVTTDQVSGNAEGHAEHASNNKGSSDHHPHHRHHSHAQHATKVGDLKTEAQAAVPTSDNATSK